MGADLVTWTMPRDEASYLLRWLRYNRPLGMPDSTFYEPIQIVVRSVTEFAPIFGDWAVIYPPGQHLADHTPRAEQGGES